MNKKENLEEKRIVIALEEIADEELLLELAQDLCIWAPFHITKENLLSRYNFSLDISQNITFEILLLFSSREIEKISRLREEIFRQEINCYISTIF